MISEWHVVLRVVLATILAGIVGMERERSERAAGLRTHAMVGLGSAAFMLISAFGFRDILGSQAVVLDPSRVAAQIVTGIGFLGAGTIIFQREMIRGLTTAASIWAVAAIGAAVGGGMYVLAGSTTLLTLAVLAGLKLVETHWFKARRPRCISLLLEPEARPLAEIETAVESQGQSLEQIVIRPGEGTDLDELDLVLAGNGRGLSQLIERLRQMPGIHQINLGK